MKFGSPLREPVRITMHLNGGFTKVLFERTIGQGMADGGITRDIRTEHIPFHLRAIGSRFVLITQPIWPEASDTVEDMRAAAVEPRCEELDHG